MNVQEEIIDILSKLSEIAAKEEKILYVVGGFIRDLLLHSLIDADIDTVLEGDAVQFASKVNIDLAGDLQKFNAFHTAKINSLAKYQFIREIDFASARREVYTEPGKLPMVSFAGLDDDLKRRDFTVNAMAVSIDDYLRLRDNWQEKIIDPFHGREDLQKKQVRILHERSFADDPTRIYRAVRYEQRIKGTIESQTLNLLREALNNSCLATISTFRIFTELKKICAEPHPIECFSRLMELGVLRHGIPVSQNEVTEILHALPRGVRGERLYLNFLAQIFSLLGDDGKSELAKSLNMAKGKIPTL